MLLTTLACRNGPSSALGAARPDAASAAPPAAMPSGPGAPAKGPVYYEANEIRGLASRIKPVKKDRLLVCGEAASANCVCLEPLPCQSQGNCITFEENVDAFRRALAAKAQGRSVDCRRAEIGACGEFRYFYFEGDIARREMRWFDGSGRMVAQRNSTDYEEYCGGKSRTRFQGKVPRCESLRRTELICGSVEGELPLPIEDVLKRRLNPTDAGKR